MSSDPKSDPGPDVSYWHTRVTCACSYGYAPVVGVLVLLAAGAANGQTLRLGIAGDKYLKPYGIVILFMSQVLLVLRMTGLLTSCTVRLPHLCPSIE
jgi:hypothetical protein